MKAIISAISTFFVVILIGVVITTAFGSCKGGSKTAIKTPDVSSRAALSVPDFPYSVSDVPVREFQSDCNFTFVDVSEPAPTDEERSRYDSAKSLYYHGTPSAAQEALLTFVTDYPNSPLADDAYYYLSELYCDSEQYDAALSASATAICQYPHSDHRGEAYFQIFSIYQHDIRDSDAAKRFYYEYLHHVTPSGTLVLTYLNRFGINLNFWFDYTLLDTVDIIDGGTYCDFLVPGITPTTPKCELQKITTVLKAKYDCSQYSVYRTEEAYKANFSASYSSAHPNALNDGLVASCNGSSTKYWDYAK